mgnify:CR=1 FL=1
MDEVITSYSDIPNIMRRHSTDNYKVVVTRALSDLNADDLVSSVRPIYAELTQVPIELSMFGMGSIEKKVQEVVVVESDGGRDDKDDDVIVVVDDNDDVTQDFEIIQISDQNSAEISKEMPVMA